ncbi:MAG: GAF domain-containing protein, partial [Flammeovirgaceae bacterium]|nr:GAF domain-containing protein [Flammeovirgaceae bacterium]
KLAGIIDKILENLSEAAHFTKSIGEGDFNVTFHPSGSQDLLGHSLITMRDRLKKATEEEKIRNWTNEGLAKFLDLLRKQQTDINALLDTVIAELVNYLKFNQGGIFIFSETEPDFLELRACYAYQKKRYIQKRLHKEQGIIGQAIQEKSTIYLTEIPDHYTEITSGLGEATPKTLLVVPLKQNQDIEGVIELASFRAMMPHEISFIEKLSENIASAIRNVKVSNSNLELVKKMQQQTEMVKQQEEELRENNEELIASQEEMRRQQLLMQETLREAIFYENCLKSFLHNSRDFFFALSKEHIVLFANQAFSSWAANDEKSVEGIRLEEIASGLLVKTLSEDLESAFKGRRLSSTRTLAFENNPQMYEFLYVPVFSEEKELVAVLVSAKNITSFAEKLKQETTSSQPEEYRMEASLVHRIQELEQENLHLKTLVKEVSTLRIENMLLDQVLQASQESFFIVDHMGTVLHISHHAAYLLGIEANDILGEHLDDILPIHFYNTPEKKISIEDATGKRHDIAIGQPQKKVIIDVLIGGIIESVEFRVSVAYHQDNAYFVVFLNIPVLLQNQQ